MTNITQEALDVEGISTVHSWKGADGKWQALIYSKTCGQEWDCRETDDGWNVNDDDGRSYERPTLREALIAATEANPF